MILFRLDPRGAHDGIAHHLGSSTRRKCRKRQREQQTGRWKDHVGLEVLQKEKEGRLNLVSFVGEWYMAAATRGGDQAMLHAAVQISRACPLSSASTISKTAAVVSCGWFGNRWVFKLGLLGLLLVLRVGLLLLRLSSLNRSSREADSHSLRRCRRLPSCVGSGGINRRKPGGRADGSDRRLVDEKRA